MALILWLIAICVLAPSTAGQNETQRLEACQRVEVYYPDGRDQAVAERVGRAVCGGMQRIGPLFGRVTRVTVRVRICSDMSTFYRLTGRPWYIAAVVLGEEIVTQPIRSLRKLENLPGTLTHELVHLLVRRVAGRNCPRWLDEGLAQWLSGQRSGLAAEPGPVLPKNRFQLVRLERRLKSPSTGREQLQKDYRICLVLTNRLIERVGERTLVGSLGGLKRHPDPLEMPVKGKPLGSWVFHPDD